jgi:hypothetical protein
MKLSCVVQQRAWQTMRLGGTQRHSVNSQRYF